MEAMSQAERQFRKTLSDRLAGKRLENDYWGCVAVTMDVETECRNLVGDLQ